MRTNMDYSFLFRHTFKGSGPSNGAAMPGSIRVSDLSSKNGRAQLKAAGIDANSKQYKAAVKSMTSQPNSAMMFTNVQAIKNMMRNYDKDGDFINPVTGIAGMDVTGKEPGSWHKLINVPEKNRQEMFDNAKREFLQENGIANGDTTKRSDVFANYQKSVSKDKRLKGTWTLGQYERQYNQAFYDAAKAADPSWKPGKPIPAGALDGITRESIDKSLVKTQGEYGETFARGINKAV